MTPKKRKRVLPKPGIMRTAENCLSCTSLKSVGEECSRFRHVGPVDYSEVCDFYTPRKYPTTHFLVRTEGKFSMCGEGSSATRDILRVDCNKCRRLWQLGYPHD